LEIRIKKENEIISEKLLRAKESQKKELYSSIENKLQQENKLKFDTLQNELNSKSTKIQNLISLEAELEKTKRDMNEAVVKAKVDSNKVYQSKLKNELDLYKNSIDDEKNLEIRELKKMLDDQKKLTNQQKMKLDQVSMQIQGEVQEDAIEEWLSEAFPLDFES
jgi:hypothetical protein